MGKLEIVIEPISMKLKLFLPGWVFISLVLLGMNYWQNTRIVPTTPWIAKDVVSGDSLIAYRQHKEFEVKLCGISAQSDKSRKYLLTLINKGDGNIVVNPVRTQWGVTVAEVFIQLKPDYETEIHINTEMVIAGMASLADDYLNCPSSYYLEMAEEIR